MLGDLVCSEFWLGDVCSIAYAGSVTSSSWDDIAGSFVRDSKFKFQLSVMLYEGLGKIESRWND